MGRHPAVQLASLAELQSRHAASRVILSMQKMSRCGLKFDSNVVRPFDSYVRSVHEEPEALGTPERFGRAGRRDKES